MHFPYNTFRLARQQGQQGEATWASVELRIGPQIILWLVWALQTKFIAVYVSHNCAVWLSKNTQALGFAKTSGIGICVSDTLMWVLVDVLDNFLSPLEPFDIKRDMKREM